MPAVVLVGQARGPVGPWVRGLVGALPAPDLFGQARGPVGPWAPKSNLVFACGAKIIFLICFRIFGMFGIVGIKRIVFETNCFRAVCINFLIILVSSVLIAVFDKH